MTVLFVDDEKQILRGIERMLDVTEVEWDAEFANSGEEALEILNEDDEIDTIVTDMRMPGMDGAELLSRVSESHPHVVRIVLSGQADKEAVFRAVNPMHQYLAKPCDAKTLRDTVCRAGALRDLIDSREIHELVHSISKLPSLPSTYQELVDASQDEECSINDLGDIVSKDPAITAKLLQFANSAVFGLTNAVNTAAQAATLLGLETLKTLVLSVGIVEELDSEVVSKYSIDQMMLHCLDVGGWARKLGQLEELSKAEIESAFTAGVLHDVGKLVLLQADPDKYLETLQVANAEGITSFEAERRIYGVDHAGAGGMLLGLWGMPRVVVEAVAFHHTPMSASEPNFSVLTAIVAANQIAHQSSLTERDQFSEYIESIQCQDRLDAWQEACKANDG